jgi:hypothetical protein
MKSAKLLNVLVLGVLLATLGAGCQRGPKNITAIPGRDVTVQNGGLNDPLGGGRRVGQDQIGTGALGAGEGSAVATRTSQVMKPTCAL